MQTTTSIKAGHAPDLLSGILSVQVRNEEKITEQDRLYCQSQQDLLYKTLNQIEKWYAIFKEDAEQYRKERQFKYEDNGKYFQRLALLEEAKSLPFGAVYDFFNLKNGVPVGQDFIASVEKYEADVTSKR